MSIVFCLEVAEWRWFVQSFDEGSGAGNQIVGSVRRNFVLPRAIFTSSLFEYQFHLLKANVKEEKQQRMSIFYVSPRRNKGNWVSFGILVDAEVHAPWVPRIPSPQTWSLIIGCGER